MKLPWQLSNHFSNMFFVEDGCVVNVQILDVSDIIVGRAGRADCGGINKEQEKPVAIAWEFANMCGHGDVQCGPHMW